MSAAVQELINDAPLTFESNSSTEGDSLPDLLRYAIKGCVEYLIDHTIVTLEKVVEFLNGTLTEYSVGFLDGGGILFEKEGSRIEVTAELLNEIGGYELSSVN